MNLKNINPLVGGTLLVFSGCVLLYLESYRNNEFISGISYFMVFGGWIVIFMRSVKNTIVSAKKVSFKPDTALWFRQFSSSIFAYAAILAIIAGTLYGMAYLVQNRKTQILTTGATDTTTAIVTHIQVRRSRNSRSYYAIFQYKVKNALIEHPRYENNGDFIEGERYTIKYSVQYPEMFLITGKLPGNLFTH